MNKKRKLKIISNVVSLPLSPLRVRGHRSESTRRGKRFVNDFSIRHVSAYNYCSRDNRGSRDGRGIDGYPRSGARKSSSPPPPPRLPRLRDGRTGDGPCASAPARVRFWIHIVSNLGDDVCAYEPPARETGGGGRRGTKGDAGWRTLRRINSFASSSVEAGGRGGTTVTGTTSCVRACLRDDGGSNARADDGAVFNVCLRVRRRCGSNNNDNKRAMCHAGVMNVVRAVFIGRRAGSDGGGRAIVTFAVQPAPRGAARRDEPYARRGGAVRGVWRAGWRRTVREDAAWNAYSLRTKSRSTALTAGQMRFTIESTTSRVDRAPSSRRHALECSERVASACFLVPVTRRRTRAAAGRTQQLPPRHGAATVVGLSSE